jgi:sugar/nucleoside kinase (ribokinase family)
MGVRNVALKLGSQGVFLAGRDCPAQQIPAFKVKAVDTTAAGDCFNAAFAVALTRGKAPASRPVTRPRPQRSRLPAPALNPRCPLPLKSKPFSPKAS